MRRSTTRDTENSHMRDSGRFRSLLVGVGADVAPSTAALAHAMELALAYRAKLTVYVFAPDLLQPFR